MYSLAIAPGPATWTAPVPRDPPQATNPASRLSAIPRPDPSASSEPRQAIIRPAPPPPLHTFRPPPAAAAAAAGSLPRSMKQPVKPPKRTGSGKPPKPPKPSSSKPANELGTLVREFPPTRSSIAIPISARPSTVYRRGCGPPFVKPTLVPSCDSTAYIISRYEVPAPALSKIDGRLMPPQLVFLVGWTDLPAAFLTVPVRNIMDYVSPYKYEEWEAEQARLRREVREEVERAEAEADANLSRESEMDPLAGDGLPKKACPRTIPPLSERMLGQDDGDEDDEDELAHGHGNGQAQTIVSLSQVPSLSTPRKPMLHAVLQQQDSDGDLDDEDGQEFYEDADDHDEPDEPDEHDEHDELDNGVASSSKQPHLGPKTAGRTLGTLGTALGPERSGGGTVANRLNLVPDPRRRPSLLAPPPVSSSVSSSSVLSDSDPRSTSITPRVGSPARYSRQARLDRGWGAMSVPSTLRNAYSASSEPAAGRTHHTPPHGSKRDRTSDGAQSEDLPFVSGDTKATTSGPMTPFGQGIAGPTEETHASKRRKTGPSSQQPQLLPAKPTATPVPHHPASSRTRSKQTPYMPPRTFPAPSPTPMGTPLQDTSADASAEDDDDEDQRDPKEWVVDRLEEVKDGKYHGRCKRFYLVRWEGFGEPTWEPEHFISKDVLDRFYASHPDIEDGRKRGRKPMTPAQGTARQGTASSGRSKKGLQQSRLSFPLVSAKKYYSVLDVMGDDELFDLGQSEDEERDGDDMEEVLLL